VVDQRCLRQPCSVDLTVIDDVPPVYIPTEDIMYVDFGYGQATNGCGLSDPKYCVDDVTVELVSCTDSQLASYRKHP
jgi:hypothetical protein